MTVVNAAEGAPFAGEHPELDPTLLSGEALLGYIASNGYACVVGSDPVGASFITDVENRLGTHLNQVNIRFEAHPDDDMSLVARFVLRGSITG